MREGEGRRGRGEEGVMKRERVVCGQRMALCGSSEKEGGVFGDGWMRGRYKEGDNDPMRLALNFTLQPSPLKGILTTTETQNFMCVQYSTLCICVCTSIDMFAQNI